MIARVSQLRHRGGHVAPRCLIIEQDVHLLAVLIELFVTHGYDVETGLYSDDLQGLAAESRPRLAVIGDGVSGSFEHGWLAARALKNYEAALPLLMLTADNQALAEVGITLRGRMFTAGLRKPFPVAELLAAAGRLCPPGSPLERSA